MAFNSVIIGEGTISSFGDGHGRILWEFDAGSRILLSSEILADNSDAYLSKLDLNDSTTSSNDMELRIEADNIDNIAENVGLLDSIEIYEEAINIKAGSLHLSIPGSNHSSVPSSSDDLSEPYAWKYTSNAQAYTDMIAFRGAYANLTQAQKDNTRLILRDEADRVSNLFLGSQRKLVYLGSQRKVIYIGDKRVTY